MTSIRPNVSGREQNMLKKHGVCATKRASQAQSLLSALSVSNTLSNLDVQYCTSVTLKPLPLSAAVIIAKMVFVAHQCISELSSIL